MRAAFLTIATTMAMLPLLAGTARADITLINQADVRVTFVITPYAPPGQEAMAVICGQHEVSAGASATVQANPSCGQSATIGANAAPNAQGGSATCRVEGVSWSDGRLTVTGSTRAIACGQ